MCSDIMVTDIEDLLQGEKVDVMYSDPPWGDGMLKYWKTMNERDTGAIASITDTESFLDRIFSISARWVNGVTFIEYGTKWKDLVKEGGVRHGLIDIATIDLLYGNGKKKRPLHLHIFSKNRIRLAPGYIDNLKDSSGYDSVRRAITPFAIPGFNKILDPCCGLGYTAQVAVDTGMVFYGNELNAKRLQRTIERLK